MQNKLVKLMARVIYRQDRTWGPKRAIVNKHYWRVIQLCDRFDFNWRQIVKEAEYLNGYAKEA